MSMSPAQRDVLDAFREGKSLRQIARDTGRCESTVRELYHRAMQWEKASSALCEAADALGADTPPRVAWKKTTPSGNVTWSAMHSIREDAPTAGEIADAVRERLLDIPPAPSVVQMKEPEANKVNLFLTADWHFGASVTAEEAGRDYNREIAVDLLREGFAACHAAHPPGEAALVIWNGDTTHADNNLHRTPRKGHPLMVEGTHHQNLLTAEENADWQIQMALEKHDEVIFAAKPGNHDPNSPAVLTAGMRARYRHDPRVTVIEDEDPFYCFQRNRLFIVAHHGDGQKPEKMAATIPYRFRREHGRSDFHFFFTSHKHHSASDVFGGIHWYQTPALCRIEQHASHMGFGDTSGMMSMSFDHEHGTVSHFLKRM